LVQTASAPQTSFCSAHSLTSTQSEPSARKPGLQAHVPPGSWHCALLVQSKSEAQTVRTSTGEHPKRPSPLKPAGQSQRKPGTRLTHTAPTPQECSEREEHSSMSKKEGNTIQQ
jgi:hypothetical protein